MSRIQKATRRRANLRLGLNGPPGAGKTYGALRAGYALAHYIQSHGHGPGRVGMVETEHESATLYIGEDPDGYGPWDFGIIPLREFSPSEYVSAISDFAKEGYDVLIIDSLSHAWEGKNGALDLVDRATKKAGNSFTAWKDVTPLHRQLVEAILSYPGHVIATLRSKTEYVLQANEKGKMEPVKVGTAPIQRQGMEYEFDIFADIDTSHILTVSKTRCKAIDGLQVHKVGPDIVHKIADWLYTGEIAAPVAGPPRISDESMGLVVDLLRRLGWPKDRLQAELPKRFKVTELRDLSPDQGVALVGWMRAQLRNLEKNKPPVRMELPTPPPAESAQDITPSAAEADTAFGLGQPPAEEQASGVGGDQTGPPGEEPAPEPVYEPLATDEQLEQCKALRSEYFALLNVSDDAEKRNLWSEILRPFAAASATELSQPVFAQLLMDLQAKVDAVRSEKAAAAAGNSEGSPPPPAQPGQKRGRK